MPVPGVGSKCEDESRFPKVSSYTVTNAVICICQSSTLMDPLNLNCLLKALSPNTITSGDRALVYGSQDRHNSLHSKGVSFKVGWGHHYTLAA